MRFEWQGMGEKLREEKGIAFILSLLLLLICAIIVVFFIHFAVQARYSAHKTTEGIVALNLADAGIGKLCWDLATNYNNSAYILKTQGTYSESPSTDPSDDLGVGYFSFTATLLNPQGPPPYHVEVISNGFSKAGEKRTLRTLLQLHWSFQRSEVFDYAIFSGHMLNIRGNSLIYGDLRSNKDINFIGNPAVKTLWLTLQTSNPITSDAQWLPIGGLQVPEYIDYDGNGKMDTPYAIDSNLDGVLDSVVKADTNGDGIPDTPLLYDSNNDGKVDSVASSGPFIYYTDTNGDGIPDSPSGNAFAGREVGSGGYVEGQRLSHQPQLPLPEIDLNYYRSIATQVYVGDKTFSGNITLNGVIYVDGAVRISGTVSGQGMIVATEGITVTGNVTYQAGSDFLALITPGNIKIAGNVTVEGLLYSHQVEIPTEVELLGNPTIHGAIIGDQIVAKGSVTVTYDPRIREIGLPLPGETIAYPIYRLAWQEL